MALDFFAGCVGGAAGVIVGHPLDTVKVRLQTQSPTNIKYRGTFHCLSTIVKQESVTGLYKGISSPLVGVAGVNALIFGVYGALKPYVSGSPGNDTLWAHFAAGSVSGAVQSVIASPMELVKTRLQINEDMPGGGKKQGPVDVLKGIYRNEGGLFRGVFKGWGITVAREIPGFGFYFASYEALTRFCDGQVGTLGMLLAGGMAGVVSWIVTFPIDVIKTRLQCDSNGKYKGILDCARKTYTAEGYRAFTRGLVSTVIRAFPTNAATFTVVTWIMRLAEGTPEDDGIQSSKQYLDELLNKTSQLQEKMEESLRLKVPHYFLCGNSLTSCSLASQCAASAQKYTSRTQVYLNFYQSLQQQIQEEENFYPTQLVSVGETESDENAIVVVHNDQDKGGKVTLRDRLTLAQLETRNGKGSQINMQGQENLIFVSSSSSGSISRNIPHVKECEEDDDNGENVHNRNSDNTHVHENTHILSISTAKSSSSSTSSLSEKSSIENRSERENNVNPVNRISSVEDMKCRKDTNEESNDNVSLMNNSSLMMIGNGEFSHEPTSFPANVAATSAAVNDTTGMGVLAAHYGEEEDDGERNIENAKTISPGGLNYLSKSLDIPVHIVEAAVAQQNYHKTKENTNNFHEGGENTKDGKIRKVQNKSLSISNKPKENGNVAQAWRNCFSNYSTPAAAMKLCRCIEDHCVCYF